MLLVLNIVVSVVYCVVRSLATTSLVVAKIESPIVGSSRSKKKCGGWTGVN